MSYFNYNVDENITMIKIDNWLCYIYDLKIKWNIK